MTHPLNYWAQIWWLYWTLAKIFSCLIFATYGGNESPCTVFSTQEFLWIQIHENIKKKLPDHLADSYKRSSVTQITTGLRLPKDISSSFYFWTHFGQLNKPS